MKNILIIVKLSISIFILSSLIATEAKAERPGLGGVNPNQYIAQLGQIAFTQGGGAFLPAGVLDSLRDGNTSMVMQYVLVNSMMNQCLKDVKKYTPNERDSFTVAQSKFKYGQCRLQRCQTQGMLLLALPLLSAKASAGAIQGDEIQNQAYVAALANGFKDQASCGGQGPAIDPGLIQLLTN